MNIIHYFASFLVLLSSTLPNPVVPQYESILDRIHFRPHQRAIHYSPLTEIVRLDVSNVTEVYIRVLECDQTVHALKEEMAKRLPSSVIPPHYHCFIPERYLGRTHAINHNTTQGLRCDQYTLSSFTTALQKVIEFEGTHFCNKETATMLQVKNMLENIQSALSNLTGLAVYETTIIDQDELELCGLPFGSNGVNGIEERTGPGVLRNSNVTNPESGKDEEERTGQQQIRTTTVSTPQTGAVSEDPTDNDLLNQHRRQRRQSDETDNEEDATPTATTPTRCMNVESAEDQFIYVTEFWFALYYLRLDLQQKRICMQNARN